MKGLRIIVSALVCTLWADVGYTQLPPYQIHADATYFTHNYTDDYEADTVSLVIKGLLLPYFGGVIDKAITTEEDTIRVRLCYWAYGSAAATYKATDTILLGIYSQGIYNVQLMVGITSSIPYDSCLYTKRKDTLDMAFPVFGATSIASIGHPSSDIRLFPNPSNGSVTISIPESLIGSTATVSDVMGRVVAAVPLTTGNRQLSTENFPNGIYFITLGNATQKLIIHH
jgi:hypothetical protein